MRMISLRIFRVRVEVEQDTRGDALVLAHEAEEDVLGADVAVAEREFSRSASSRTFFARGVKGLPRGDLVALPDDASDLRGPLPR